MIRVAKIDDRDSILKVAVDSGLFPADEIGELSAQLDEHFASSNSVATWLVDEEPQGLASVAMFEPERMTEGTFNLLMIAVSKKQQRTGRGSAMLGRVEEDLREKSARLLLVETLGIPDFEDARAFYASRGFAEEARIREFYCPGGDKIVFRKLLS